MRKNIFADYPGHECGIFGVFNHPQASHLTYLGLYALQHRGEESAGIVSSDFKRMYVYKHMGVVADVFDEKRIQELKGELAIGHVRYSTTGSSLLKNAQPLLVDCIKGAVAIGHNGNLINAVPLRKKLESEGSIFQTTVDSEIIIHLMAKAKSPSWEESLISALKEVDGAYSLVLMTKDSLVAVRDPHGFRPLSVGKLGHSYVVASETCALDLIEAEYLRDVEPGEVLIIDKNGLRSLKPFAAEKKNLSFCIFEQIYFARPDSFIFGENVHLFRQNLGCQLAKEHPMEADIVIPIPDSGNSAALGYAHHSRIMFEMGMTRNHYIGRTFIQPLQHIRDFNVRVKLNPVKAVLKNKRVIVVDDSIVRGTTCRIRVENLRSAGAKEVHMRISCPPHRHPCFYGIDFPSQKELIAHTHNLNEIKKYLNVDTLGYLSIEGLLGAVKKEQRANYCAACFTGSYPSGELSREWSKYCLEARC